MATDVLRVPGDYKIIAQNGDIILDLLGANTGTVRIYGNLSVFGTSTTFISTNTYIKDKVLVLNYQDDGTPPVDPTGNVSGFLVDSFDGNANHTASLLYNNDSTWKTTNVNTSTGVFEFTSYGSISAIKVNAIRIDPATATVNSSNTSTLNFLGKDNPLSVLSVAGTTDYESQVTDDDDIPNKKYVDNRIFTGTTYAKILQVGNSYVKITDNSVPFSDPFYSSDDKIIAVLGNTGTDTNIVFRLEGVEAQIQGLTISNNTIEVNNTATDLVLQPQDGSSVRIATPLRFQRQDTSTVVIATTNTTGIYYKEPAAGGGTGLYFVNTNRTDELVSRRKAIIYGIIF